MNIVGNNIQIIDSVDFMHANLNWCQVMFSVIELILDISKVVFLPWITMMFDILS